MGKQGGKKRKRAFVGKVIRYRDRASGPHGRKLAITIDAYANASIDNDAATALVAVRTGLPLARVDLVEVVDA